MSRCWIEEYDESFNQEAWLGYEFWSAQVEAEMESIGPEEGDIEEMAARMQRIDAQFEGGGDVLPF